VRPQLFPHAVGSAAAHIREVVDFEPVLSGPAQCRPASDWPRFGFTSDGNRIARSLPSSVAAADNSDFVKDGDTASPEHSGCWIRSLRGLSATIPQSDRGRRPVQDVATSCAIGARAHVAIEAGSYRRARPSERGRRRRCSVVSANQIGLSRDSNIRCVCRLSPGRGLKVPLMSSRIRRMFHRWQLCFIPRMTHSPIYNLDGERMKMSGQFVKARWHLARDRCREQSPAQQH
jgi:hypothetical protein